MSRVRVTKATPLAMPGEPSVPIVRIPVGEHALSKFPDWAIARLVERGDAELIATETVKVEDDPEAAAALAAAKEEEARIDRVRREAEAKAAKTGKGKQA